VAATALLVDTDVLIDYLRGIRPARALLDADRFDFYYSSQTRKELLSKPGLTDSVRREIQALLRRLRVVLIDDSIAGKYWSLLKKYESQGLRQADAIIAATAWQKRLPLLTRNHRHFRFVDEIELAPIYEIQQASAGLR